ncbi:MAG: right-handed parallel beta-helix repeat-containing protein [Chloroflexota bacterium]|nr:right-handed parallel beta-helix repeat-containing protein [Anaerolineales bacterium]
MKFKLKQAQEQPPKTKLNFQKIYGSMFFQGFLLLVAFSTGVLVYRAGLLTPVISFVRQVFSGEPINVKLEGPLSEVQKNIVDETRMYEENGLQTLFIDLKFKHYQKMLEKRAEALQTGILQTTDEDFVPVQVQLKDGPKLDGKIRLKGDWTDHLQGDKWSFRIHLKSDGQVLSFRQFSLQTPETRNFLNEWAFHQNLLDEGILTTRYDFINVLLNGKLLGIYAIEEHFAPELIESQGRRAGVIIRFDEDLLWDSRANFWEDGLHVDSGAWQVTDESSADITTFQESKVAANPVLKAEADTARAMLRAYQTGERTASETFDVELMGRYFALTDLWSACHGVYWHNWRFYYNPVTGLLEPVAFDNEPFQACAQQRASISDEFISSSSLFNDPEIRAAYAHEVARITQPGYLEKLQDQLGTRSAELESALRVEYPQDYDTLKVGVDWSTVRARQKILAQELQPANPVKGTFQASGVLEGDSAAPSLRLELTNLMILPVEVVRVEVNETPLSLPAGTDLTLEPVIDPKNAVFHPIYLTVPLTDKSPWQEETRPQVDVIVRLAGLQTEIRAPLDGASTPDELTVGPLPEAPSLQELLDKHPFLSASPDKKMLLVSPGTWDVSGDLILPDGIVLDVSAGTALRFEPEAVVLVRGPVNLMGTVSEPIVLGAQDAARGWGGIVVLNAGTESVWKYAKVENTFGIARGGWILTGGITFFKSDIRLDHTILGNNHTEDAINVIHSKFAFIDSEFINAFADAFDSDFSEGEIRGCYFHDIQGDAIDISGTPATVSDTRIERIVDKGVSVGEHSEITISNVTMDTVGIGVASKDLSKAYVSDTTISHARFSAFAAYIKKPVYGPGYIEATNVKIIATETSAVAQIGSTILLDKKPVETVDMDVDKLYDEGILGN